MLKKLLLTVCVLITAIVYPGNNKRQRSGRKDIVSVDNSRTERPVDPAPVVRSVASRLMISAGKKWMQVPEPLRCVTYGLIGTAIGYGGMSAIGGREVVSWG